MTIELKSPCKVNLVLNILGQRQDGYHELETLLHPVHVFDDLSFSRAPRGIKLQCSDPALPTDERNLVHRAAAAFLSAAGIKDGVTARLQKRIPLAAGLGGGSSNAAITLLALNALYGEPMTLESLQLTAASIGSDVPFFLQSRPALATGRGEVIRSMDFFRALHNCYFVLIHPGFGIPTAWAYEQLKRFPAALNGTPGKAARLAANLLAGDLQAAKPDFYNSLEAPALEKHPLLAMFKEFLHEQGAVATLMSGSGSTTFAIMDNQLSAERLTEAFKSRFGTSYWITTVRANK